VETEVRELKIGFGRADITPPIGAEMPGAFNKRHNVGVHDPLLASAMVVDDGCRIVGLVGLDSLSVPHSVVRAAETGIAEACGTPISLIVGASHTHSGGPVATALGSESDPWYLDLLTRRIAQSVILGYRARVPALLGSGRGYDDTTPFNRRFWMRNGRQATHPGKGNGDIVRVAGPIDPEVAVLGTWGAQGQYLGCVANFTLHCTVMGGLEVSADYPAYLRRTVEAAMGANSITVFLNGAYGDVTQVANTLQREREFGEKWARKIGTILGAEVVKVLATMEPGTEGEVAVADETVLLQPRSVDPGQLATAQHLLATEGAWDTERWYARELVLLDALNVEEPQVPAAVRAISIGGTALVAIPGELFCQFGLDIKAGSPFRQTMVVGTANGCVGYLPTAEAMGPQGGGYEPRLCRSSKLVPEAGYQLRDTALRLLHRLPVPSAATASEVRDQPWEVGASRPGN
jgi:hypothetical protein